MFKCDELYSRWVRTTEFDMLSFQLQSVRKLTSNTLEFYFRFWVRPHLHNRNVIRHLSAKFRRNLATCDGIMTSYQFFSKIQWIQVRRPEHERLQQSCEFNGSMAVLTPPPTTIKTARLRRRPSRRRRTAPVWRTLVGYVTMLLQFRSSGVCLSVCRLSVTFVHPAQRVGLFGSILRRLIA